MKELPLVTVGILTYNSATTILDTLESAKQQNYINKELIISDDASSDDTVNLCSEWIDQNAGFFVRTEIVTTPKNTGTCANCNRLINKCNGEWLAMIGGDDIFLPDSIAMRVNFALCNPDAEWIFSKAHTYMDTFEPHNILFSKEHFLYTPKWKSFFYLTNDKQIEIQAKVNMLAPPSDFFKVDTLKKLGGYDEKYFIIEDAPMNFKLLKNGVKCYLLDEFTIGYRIGINNVCSNKTRLFNYRHLEISYQVKRDYCWAYYTWNWKVYLYCVLKLSKLFDRLNINNADSTICTRLYKFQMSILRRLLCINIKYR